MHVAGGAAAQILHLGRDAQRAVLQFLVFLQQPHQRLIVAVDAALRALGLGRFDILGRAFVFCLVAHRRFPSFEWFGFAPDIEVWRPKIKGQAMLGASSEDLGTDREDLSKLIQILP